MAAKRFTFLVAVHAFFVKDKKVLLLERKNTGYKDGFYSVPAGHVDGGELIATAMRREIEEETGIKLDALSAPAHVMHRIVSDSEERIDYFYLVTNWKGKPKNAEPEKCSEVRWISTTELPANMVPYVRYAWQQIHLNQQFSEFQEC